MTSSIRIEGDVKHKSSQPQSEQDEEANQPEARDVNPPPRANAEPWNLRVLVLEDSGSDYYWISSMLTRLDEYDVRPARAITIAEAAELTATQVFDLALIDYRLPDGFGDAFVATLHMHQPNCAAVMLSGDKMPEVSLFGLNGGAVAAIDKDDCNPTLMETTIRFALRNHANQERLRQAPI
ncbi:MAG: response regulator [Pseudomonadota bacterium]